MNPHVFVAWMEVVQPFLFSTIFFSELCHIGDIRKDLLGRIGMVAVAIALTGICVANLFYQGVLGARAWPAVRIGDQVIVTPAGDVYVKVRDPIDDRADRVQRYSCLGEFKAFFQPDNAGGVFKIAVNPDETLGIYSVRTRSIDTFNRDGHFLQRRETDSQGMPFAFLNPGPSVLKAGDCEFVMEAASGRPAIKSSAGIRLLENGDWLLEDVLTLRNVVATGLLGLFLLLISYMRICYRKAVHDLDASGSYPG